MNDYTKACFFTGHRIIPYEQADKIRFTTRKFCIDLIENHGVTDFIAGGALGFDTLAEGVVLDLKRVYPQIKLHLYLPCRNQFARWNKKDIEMWKRILNEADDYRYITDSNYVTGCMQLRNREMVRDAYYGIAYYTHGRSGTASTIKYAINNERKIKIINL